MRNVILALTVIGVTACLAAATVQTNPHAAKHRVGTYDSRAIAVAYAASKYNPVNEKRKEQAAAKTAGDSKRAKELEAWGAEHQRNLHRQGFGRVPVDDLLVHVQTELAKVAAKAGVEAIAMHCDFALPEIEVVDITDEMVELYEPNERTLGFVKDLKKHAPLELDKIEQAHDH